MKRSAFVIIFVLCAACGDSRPTSPTAITRTTPFVPPVQTTTVLPPLEGSSRTFTFDHALTPLSSIWTRSSRFILYDNGSFMLEYPAVNGAYRGKYTESNGAINFEWEGWSRAGPWGASGTINGDALSVEYNLIMMLTDFEDAAYTLVR
jgi:hypothetical protein